MGCESWCDRGLPPDGVPGWGFLVNDAGYVAERYKLSAESMRKRGMVLAWCSCECRETCIARQKLHDAPVNPAPDNGEATARTIVKATYEAEGICARWVPHHMTARLGLVNDIAGAIDTWHRLGVEAGRKDAFREAVELLRKYADEVDDANLVGTGNGANVVDKCADAIEARAKEGAK